MTDYNHTKHIQVTAVIPLSYPADVSKAVFVEKVLRLKGNASNSGVFLNNSWIPSEYVCKNHGYV